MSAREDGSLVDYFRCEVRYSAPMLGRRSAAAAVFACAAVLSAQTVGQSEPDGTSHTTENSHAVTGVRIQTMPDGSVWFLVPSNDRIVHLQGDTLTQWQVRDDKNLGLNPVDFEIDGSSIWFIGNGESLIDPGRSVLARLDTDTGALREWVLPGSKPAGFWRAPDGKAIWVPQTDGRLQSFDPTVVQTDPKTGNPAVDPATGLLVGSPVIDYRSRSDDGSIYTFAYADVVPAPDGSLWLADFGNNRIVRYLPGADTETSWTLLDPSIARINLSQIHLDSAGRVWVSQLTNFAISYLDPPSNILVNFNGLNYPVHFDIFQGRLYVAEAPTTSTIGGISVLDPLLARPGVFSLTPVTVPVHNIVNPKPVLIRDSTITPTTFNSPSSVEGTGTFTVTAGADGRGVLRTAFSSGKAYGITVADGYVWAGSDNRIVRLNLQDFGDDADACVPLAVEVGASDPTTQDQDRVDVTLANTGDSTITGNINYLYSPAAFSALFSFTLAPHATSVQEDIFAGLLGDQFPLSGPVRIQVTGGNAGDLVASARSIHSRASDGALYGFTLPALSSSGSIGLGEQVTLFTSGRDGDETIMGLYTSSRGAGAQATATLVAADGTVRGTRSFDMPNNALLEYGPAASAFGVEPQAGDVVRITGGGGSLRAYVRVPDPDSGAQAGGLPVHPTWNAVAPYSANGLGADGTGPVTDLYFSNPDPTSPAAVTISLLPSSDFSGLISRIPLSQPRTRGSRPNRVPVSPAAASPAHLTLPPGGSLVVPDVLQTLFGISAGSGALKIVANGSIASAVRVASRKADGDYATFVGSIDGSQGVPPGGTAFVSGLQQIPNARSTDLLLSNGGGDTTVTLAGYDGNGSRIRTLPVALAAGQSVRIAEVLHVLGLDGPGEVRNARVGVSAAADALVYAAFVQTDAVTGDPEVLLPR
jgi:streptogramin lyase